MDAAMTALGQPGGPATATAERNAQYVYPTTFPASFPLGHLKKAKLVKGKGYAIFENAVADKMIIFFIAIAVCGIFMFLLLTFTHRSEAGKKREDTMISEATHSAEHKGPHMAMGGAAPPHTPPVNRHLMPGTHSRGGSIASSVGSSSTVSTTVNGYLAPPGNPYRYHAPMYSTPAGAGSASTFSSTSSTASMNPYQQYHRSANTLQPRPRYNQYQGPPPPMPEQHPQRPQLLAPPPRVDRRPRAPAWRGPGHPGLPSQQPHAPFGPPRPPRPPAQPQLHAPHPQLHAQQVAFAPPRPQAQQPHAAFGPPRPPAQQPHAAFGPPRPPAGPPGMPSRQTPAPSRAPNALLAYPQIPGPPIPQSRQQAPVAPVRSASQSRAPAPPPKPTAGPHAALASPPNARPFSPTSPPMHAGTPLWAQ